MTPFIRFFAIFWTLFYAYSYNSYFGNNWSPQSANECICDGIFVLMNIVILAAPSKTKPTDGKGIGDV